MICEALLFLMSSCMFSAHSDSSYWENRESFLREERSMFLGADIVLTAEEEEVNAILMKIKEKEYRKGFNDPASFPPARHFFEVKEDIERSEVFRIIQLLPKEAYPDVNTVWKVFEKITKTVNGLVYYKPAFERYFYQLLKEFHEDNIMYAELRSEVSGVFELNGTLLPETAVATIMKDITQRFISDHPDFWGIKIIYTSFRRLELSEVEQYIANALTLKEEHPDLIAGFDIIGQEDLGKPLKDFADLLLTVKDDIKFFFHAGETDWEGITDLNLVDAVLLNATRIGHGYAILKHPLVLETVKRLGIPIEVNPISNQVLLLVADLRNHPAATLIAENYHVVISSDDPGFWGAKGLSYDIYEAFMGLAGLEADLRVLKQLALNSLRYSALDEETKEDIISAWEQTWTLFLNAVLNMTRH
ncbi:adenosine deaminase 2-like isoform X3 [Periplaneta americana]|uniref:adenosine deaminase 2-like isoform X3 n=1 Tax=Periplaneta americana TaxID=6978 RepID=UPI0037E9C54B